MTITIAPEPRLRLQFADIEQAQLWIMDMLQHLEIPVYGLDWIGFLKDHLLQPRQGLNPVTLCLYGAGLADSLKGYRMNMKGGTRAR